MEIYKKRRYAKILSLLFLTIIFLSSKSLHADVYTYNFSDDLEIWDISGTYEDDGLGCTISLTMNQDSKGKITGSGLASCDIYSVDINMAYDIKGTIKQKNNTAAIKLSIKYKGTAEYMGDSYKFTAKQKVNAEIDAADQMMYGTIKVKLKMAGEKISEKSVFSERLPYDMDGSFNLTIELDRDGKKLFGNSVIELSNGNRYSLSAKGKVNNKKGQAKLKLKGDNTASKGCKLQLIIDERDDSVKSIKGKVAGQKIKN
jgi:hypothetical protein